jgi:hypothetical protein
MPVGVKWQQGPGSSVFTERSTLMIGPDDYEANVRDAASKYTSSVNPFAVRQKHHAQP